MKYCTHCGKELLDEAVICPSCGCRVDYTFSSADISVDLIHELSERVKINGVVWICIACIQFVLALTVNWVLGIIAVLNLISALRDLNYSKEVLTNPMGIVEKFEPIILPIIILVYNVFIGGVIGIAGSIYYFVGIRSFILKNKELFEKYNSVI